MTKDGQRLIALKNKYNIPRGDLGQRTCSSEKQNKQSETKLNYIPEKHVHAMEL